MTTRKRPLSYAAKVRRFNRIKMNHPALAKLTAGIPQTVWSLAQADDENEPNHRSADENSPMSEARTPLPKRTEDHLEWYSQLLKSLAVHLYENQLELSPHIYGPHRRPPVGYDPDDSEIRPNPFRRTQATPIPLQPSMLTAKDAIKVFDGISFAMWEHGKALNAHVVVVWSMIPDIDEAKAAKILGRYLNEASKWVAVKGGPRSPTRQGGELHYVWVHENAPDRGFHTHILMNIGAEFRKEFDVWSRSCLARLCKTAFHEKAFRVVLSRSRREIDQVQRVWSWFRYLMKQLDPGAGLGFFSNNIYSEMAMREIVKPWPIREWLPIRLTKRVGVSHSIGDGAQKMKRFVSKLRSGEINQMYHGREFADRTGADLFKNEKYPPWHCEFR